jgi:hypothetical protein
MKSNLQNTMIHWTEISVSAHTKANTEKKTYIYYTSISKFTDYSVKQWKLKKNQKLKLKLLNRDTSIYVHNMGENTIQKY